MVSRRRTRKEREKDYLGCVMTVPVTSTPVPESGRTNTTRSGPENTEMESWGGGERGEREEGACLAQETIPGKYQVRLVLSRR